MFIHPGVMAIEIMDEGQKRRIGIYSLLPLLALALAGTLHLLVFRHELAARDMADHIALATRTFRNFALLATAYTAASIVSLAVLLYFIVHLLRLKTVAPGEKIFWAVMLTMFIPFSFPLFWYFRIRKEPRQLEVYPGL